MVRFSLVCMICGGFQSTQSSENCFKIAFVINEFIKQQVQNISKTFTLQLVYAVTRNFLNLF